MQAQTVVEADRLPIPQVPLSDDEANESTDVLNLAAPDSAPSPDSTSDSNAAEVSLDAMTLTLSDVIASVYTSFPKIEKARLERARASGQITGAYGAYDTKLQGYTLSEPTGFYHNFRQGIGVARQTWWGGYVAAGYRIGRGDFQPWYKERETNEGGEFKLGMAFPLLQGRAIDPQRLAVFQASLAAQAADPLIQQAILDHSRAAALAYWQWVTAGMVLEAQRELLDLAERRGEQFRVGVEAGKFPEIDLIFNQQLIAERRGKLIETEQKFRSAGFKLSIFLRDELGQPIVPQDDWMPAFYPTLIDLSNSDYQQDLAAALQRRPEPRSLRFELRQVALDRQLASNQMLPQLDVIAEASQDVGFPASSSNDKGQFELLFGLQGEVPIQRRKARGKIQETNAKIAQINQELRLVQDKIGVELQSAFNALSLFAEQIQQAEAALVASLETLSRYRFAFDRGKVDLIYINLLESKANESEIKLVVAQESWFSALAEMQFALGLDPLDQAIAVAALEPSGRPGPSNLPALNQNDKDEKDAPEPDSKEDNQQQNAADEA